MKTSKLIKHLSELLSEKTRNRKKQCKQLRLLLTKLRVRQKELEEKFLQSTDAEKSGRIQRDLKIIRRQREKALKLLRELQHADR